jgi:phosphohistidine phosphatase
MQPRSRAGLYRIRLDPLSVKIGRVRTLYLLRHAKSSWDDAALADRDRPLAPRGQKAAKLMAEHLRRDGIAPGLVLCSVARRTRETLEAIEPALGGPEIEVERDLYGASAGELLERLQAVPDGVESVMLIGHNPSIQTLALNLAGRGDDLDAIGLKYPTGALATLTFEGSWQELDRGGAELAGFVRPRDLG